MAISDKEGEQHVTAPEQHGADFEEEEKERPQPERSGIWRRQRGRLEVGTAERWRPTVVVKLNAPMPVVLI